MHGSGALVRWLLGNQLVDEITLLVCPVVVGQGTRLFPATGPDAALDRVESRTTPKGVSIQVYRPTGRPQMLKQRGAQHPVRNGRARTAPATAVPHRCRRMSRIGR